LPEPSAAASWSFTCRSLPVSEYMIWRSCGSPATAQQRVAPGTGLGSVANKGRLAAAAPCPPPTATRARPDHPRLTTSTTRGVASTRDYARLRRRHSPAEAGALVRLERRRDAGRASLCGLTGERVTPTAVRGAGWCGRGGRVDRDDLVLTRARRRLMPRTRALGRIVQ
jgi:hypothetical protein